MKTFKGKTKYIIMLILAAVLLIQSANALSDNKQSNGDNQRLSLGMSVNDVTIQEEGSLADGTLKLVLSSSEPMYQIRMTPPNSPMTLGMSGVASAPPTVTFGESGSFSTEFDAPIKGVYTFDLYDDNNQFVQTVSYDVRGGTAVSIALDDGVKFSLRKTLKVDLSYTPQISGEAEVLTVILPPYFNVTTMPTGGAHYTVTPLSGISLPEEYYNDPASDILKNYNLKCNGFQIEFDSTVSSALSFNFSYTFNSDYTSLGRIMTAYGENPDIIPLRVIAFGKSKVSQVLVDYKIIEGSSIITDVDGNPIPEALPVVNTKENYPINYNYFYEPPKWGTDNRQLISIASWHYPVSEITLYSPVPDGTTSNTTLPVVQINGNNYIELKTTDIISVNNGELREISTPVSPKNQSSILSGQVFDFANSFVSYTYRGQKYTQMKSVGYAPYTVPSRMEAEAIGSYFIYSNPNGVGGLLRKQGQQGDIYTFAFGNAAQEKPSGAFNDATVRFDFPFEVSPVAVKYDLGANSYGPPDNIAPKLIKYYVYGESVPRTITPPAAVAGQFPTINFPGSPHVTKIELLYDKIPPASRFEYWITVNNGTKDESGAELAPLIDRQFIATITTADGNMVYGDELPDRVKVPFVYQKVSDYQLYKEVIAPPDPIEDSLYFGTYYYGVPQKGGILKMFQTLTPQHGDNAQITLLRKTSKQMIDYKDIVITSKPKTEADKAGFSLVSGIYLHNLKPGNQVGAAKVSYLTNLSPTTWKVAERTVLGNTRDYYPFKLLDGEYTLEIKTEIDVLYGSKMIPYLGSTVNDNAANGVIFNNNSDWNGIFLGYSGSHRKYFSGVEGEEYLIKENDRWVFDNTITLSSPAQHIREDGAGASFVNDTAPSVISEFKLYGSAALGREDSATVSFDPSVNRTYYQGQIFRFYMRNNGVNLAQSPGGLYNFKLKYYLELYNDFELLEIENKNYTFLEARPIPANGTTLYIYEVSSSNNIADPWMKIRVRPDAKSVDNVPMIKAAGVSHTSFVEDHLLPNTGDNAYYNNSPYYRITMNPERKFPPEWGSVDKLQYTYRAGVNINIFYKVLEKIDLNSKVGTVIQQGQGILESHNMNKFSVEASISGDLDSVIERYDALFTIPRKGAGGETPTIDELGIVHQLDNDFDIYLKGPVTVGLPESQYSVTYYTDYEANQTITITSASSEEDLKSVTKVLVSLANLPVKATQIVNIPLHSTTKKTGAFTDVEHSYIGVSVSKKAGASMEPFRVHEALTFAYESYELSMRMGLDTDEDGRLRNSLVGIGEFQVFYNDGTSDIMLPPPTIVGNTHTLKVNDDVSHIKISYSGVAQDKYLLTLQNGAALTEDMDSDFPRDAASGGQLNVLVSDLYSGAANKYDAAFIIKPTLPIKDFVLLNALAVPKGDSKSQLVDFKLSTTGAVVPARNYYKQEITNIADPTIGNVFVNSTDKKIYSNGTNLGETTFTYTLTNRLGDKFVVDGVKVNVVKNYVTKAVVRKSFAVSHANLGTDTFSVSIWNEGTASNPINPKLVTGVNETTDTPVLAFVERGMTHYISEEAKVGYETLGFTGNIDGTPIVFTDKGNAVYSFDVPMSAVNVSITANNRNASTDMFLRKEMDEAAVDHNPNQSFVISITEKGTLTPIETATLKNGETKLVSGLVFGRTYLVEETPVIDYVLESVNIQKSSANIGTQPTKNITNDHLYEFRLMPNHNEGEIVVSNQLSSGKGLILYKDVILDSALPKEDFKFTLALPDGGSYYGIVPSSTTTFPALVKWYTDSNHTVEVATNATELKTGEYTLTEDSGLNYQLEEFKVVSGGALATSTKTTINFKVTAVSEELNLSAKNKLKEGGAAVIRKHVDPNYLADTMAFTLTHSTGRTFVSEAKVTSEIFLFKTWTENGVIVSENTLPYGRYIVTETLEGEHYKLDKFLPGAGISILDSGKSAAFVLTNSSASALVEAENMLFEKGALIIKHVPAVDYGSLEIGKDLGVVKRTSDAYVEVENTLVFPTNWTLKIISGVQTATVGGGTVTLPYQALKYSKDGTEYVSLGSKQTIMDQAAPKAGSTHRLDWSANDSAGIIADVWFHPATRPGHYSSDITWSIEITP